MNFIDDESRHERFVAEARLWDCIKEQHKGDRYDFIAPDGDNINSPKRLLGSKHSINFQQEERVKKTVMVQVRFISPMHCSMLVDNTGGACRIFALTKMIFNRI
jgi:hypothetical protein